MSARRYPRPVRLDAMPEPAPSDRYETSDEERRHLAEALFILMLALARGEVLDAETLAKAEEAGVTAEQLDTIAEDVARERSAAVVGMKWQPDGTLARDPSIASDIVTTEENAVNRAIARSDAKLAEMEAAGATEAEIAAEERATIEEMSNLRAFDFARADGILDYEMATLATAMELSTWEASGVTSVRVRDAWDESHPNHCEICIAADGQVWSIAQAMANIKEHNLCCRLFVPMWPGGARLTITTTSPGGTTWTRSAPIRRHS